MSSHRVHVRAPCRLHFGMLGFGHATQRQFGGVGVMVEAPAVELTFAPAERFAVEQSHAQRVEHFARSAAREWGLSSLPACKITVRAPPDHVGLGIGTQLGLAVAAGLRRFVSLPDLPPEQLAASVGRAARSSVGTYGFQHGGLIVDAGKLPGQPVGTLARRVALPADWRFLSVRPADGQGLAGQFEADAFASLPPVPEHLTRQLWQITDEQMLPAVERADCADFGEAVYRYGRLAGECFAPVQGGPFASPQIAQLVEEMRSRGVAGVGQSSWGPTVFAILASAPAADSLAAWLRQRGAGTAAEITIAPAANRGATVQ